MHQTNLFAAPALLTGVRISYSFDPVAEWGAHHVVVTPQWSKTPAKGAGVWSGNLAPDEVELVPDLLRTVWNTLHVPDVSTFMPRNLQRKCDEYHAHYQDQNRA